MTEADPRAALEAATGSGRCDEAVPVRGGCINRCYAVRRGAERLFVKLNDLGFADAFAAEADGLTALAAGGLRVPAPVGYGATDEGAYLVLEHLALGRGTDSGFRALGEQLAAMHAVGRDGFGWHRDNYIGATPQANARYDDWTYFWIDTRLGPQLALAAARGHRVDAARAMAAAQTLLAEHRPRASLLHGDLWSGNVGFLADGTPVVFDPAVYAGDAEADLAMTALFGGFPTAFLQGYQSVRPSSPGETVRRDLYNLYHVLNHLNLFGGSYLAQARDLIDRLDAEAG